MSPPQTSHLLQGTLALSTYDEVLNLSYDIFGKHAQNQDLANTLNNVANVYSHKEDHQTSLEWYQKSLKMGQAFYGSVKNRDIGMSHHNIGRQLRLLGQNDKALNHLEEALAINQQILGKNHINTANTLLELSNTHLAFNDTKSAKKTIAEAYEIATKAEGTPGLKQGIEKAFKALH